MNKEELYNEAKNAYYNGEAIMSDAEFDALESELGLENSGYVGTHHQKSYTVKHPFIMGSLSKIQVKFTKDDETIHFADYIQQVHSYLDKSYKVKCLYDKSKNIDDWYFETTPKYDGCSWEAVIDGNELVSVSTRGDGKYGKDIKTWFEPYFTEVIEPKLNDFTTKNCNSSEQTFIKHFVIRGECLIKKAIFEQKYLGKFKMPRSFVAGCLGQDWEGTPEQMEMRNDLSWMCYDYRKVYDNEYTVELDYSGYMDKSFQRFLPDYSKDNIPGDKPSVQNGSMLIHKYGDIQNFEQIYKFWEKYRKECEFELDGFVIKPGASFRLQDNTRARQEDCVAIKFTPEIVDAAIIDIEWNVGKSGEYYPTGILDTIVIGGKNVDRVSLANYASIIKKQSGIGAKIKVSLAGDIIPFIYGVTEPSDVLNTPEDSYLDENGHLMKQMTDSEKEFVKFLNSIKVIKADGIGEAVAEKLHNIFQTNNILDFMIDDNQDWKSALDESKSSMNILKSLDERKLTLSLVDVIQSLGYENCGEKNALWLAKKVSNINVDTKGIPATIIELSSDDHFNELVKYYIGKLNVHYLKENKASEGKIPVILTGAPFEGTKAQWMKNHPEYVETTSWKDVKILFTNDLNSTSSKMTKAKKNGVEIKLYD